MCFYVSEILDGGGVGPLFMVIAVLFNAIIYSHCHGAIVK